MSSFLRRVWNKIRSPTGCVGRDLEGNKYYEYPNPHGDFERPKRVVKYRRGYDMWTYIAGERRLPVQWTSWLTHTRFHPPTLEELQADLARIERVRMNAALIEAKDREAAAAVAQLNAPAEANPVQARPAQIAQTDAVSSENSEVRQDHASSPSLDPNADIPISKKIPTGWKPTPADETQSWTPRAVRRGS